jgi:hypothetical protein
MTDITIHEGSSFVHFGGTVWPTPGSRLRDLEHSLRYAQKGHIFNMQDRLLAASAINAYIELVWQTQKRRNEISANLCTAAQND